MSKHDDERGGQGHGLRDPRHEVEDDHAPRHGGRRGDSGGEAVGRHNTAAGMGSSDASAQLAIRFTTARLQLAALRDNHVPALRAALAERDHGETRAAAHATRQALHLAQCEIAGARRIVARHGTETEHAELVEIEPLLVACSQMTRALLAHVDAPRVRCGE